MGHNKSYNHYWITTVRGWRWVSSQDCLLVLAKDLNLVPRTTSNSSVIKPVPSFDLFRLLHAHKAHAFVQTLTHTHKKVSKSNMIHKSLIFLKNKH